MSADFPSRFDSTTEASIDRLRMTPRYLLRYRAGEWVEVDAVLYEAALREMAEDPDMAAGVEAVVVPR
jgi:hypothetical protein